MTIEEIKRLLEAKGIASTPNRLLVMMVLTSSEKPLSLSEMEGLLETVDRSSIFRVLKLFQEHGLIHTIDIGSGVTKFEYCPNGIHNDTFHTHAHFYCEKCKRIIPLNAASIPLVEMPDGCKPNEINYVVHGICNYCRKD